MVKISFLVNNGTAAPLFCQYPGALFPQRAHLEFAPNDGLELLASYNPDSGVPARVWDKKAYWFSIPPTASRASIEALAHDADLESMLVRLADGDSDVEFEIQNYLDGDGALDTVSVWLAHEWVGQAELDLSELVECGCVEALSDLIEPDPADGQVVVGDLADAVAAQVERQLEWADRDDELARRAAAIVAAYRD